MQQIQTFKLAWSLLIYKLSIFVKESPFIKTSTPRRHTHPMVQITQCHNMFITPFFMMIPQRFVIVGGCFSYK